MLNKLKINSLKLVASIYYAVPRRPSDSYLLDTVHNAIDVATELRSTELDGNKLAKLEEAITVLHNILYNRHLMSTADIILALEFAADTLNSCL